MMKLAPWVARLLIVPLAFFSIGCSTQYVGHHDESEPHKSESLEAKVKFTKQSDSSVDPAMINYLFSKSYPVENYYHGTDIYKRSSWLGVGVMIAGAAVGCYGIYKWSDAKEYMPYTSGNPPNPDYEAEKQAGQTLALVGVGIGLIGAAIHFITNREVTKNTMKVETSTTSKPLSYSPIRIFHEEKLISSMKTDITGNFKIDLSPFIQDSYRGRNINLRITSPEFPSAVENLSISTSKMKHLDQLRQWEQEGFNPASMQKWIDSGFTIPQEALLWKNAELSPRTARSWTDSGFATPQAALPWIQIGGITSSRAKIWNEKGLTPEQARILVEKEREAAALANAEKEAERKEYATLKAQAKDMGNLILTNPYDVKDRIYEVTGQRIQLLSKSIGLYRADTFIFLADFGTSSAPYIFFEGLARGADPYTYTTTLGAQSIVPRLNVLYFKELATQ